MRLFIRIGLTGLLGLGVWLPAGAQQKPKAAPKLKFSHGSEPGANSALRELQLQLGPAITVKAAAGAAGTATVQFQRPATAVIVTPAGLQVPRAGQAPLEFRNAGQPGDTAAVVYEYRGFDKASGLLWLCRHIPGCEPRLLPATPSCSTHLLVSLANGQVVELVGPPQLNAARTLVLAEYAVLTPAKPVGLQLWRVEKGRLQLLQDVRLVYWNVVRSKWLGPNRLWLDMGSMWDWVMGTKPCRQTVELTIR